MSLGQKKKNTLLKNKSQLTMGLKTKQTFQLQFEELNMTGSRAAVALETFPVFPVCAFTLKYWKANGVSKCKFYFCIIQFYHHLKTVSFPHSAVYAVRTRSGRCSQLKMLVMSLESEIIIRKHNGIFWLFKYIHTQMNK